MAPGVADGCALGEAVGVACGRGVAGDGRGEADAETVGDAVGIAADEGETIAGGEGWVLTLTAWFSLAVSLQAT